MRRSRFVGKAERPAVYIFLTPTMLDSMKNPDHYRISMSITDRNREDDETTDRAARAALL
jgi:hypothetical protein